MGLTMAPAETTTAAQFLMGGRDATYSVRWEESAVPSVRPLFRGTEPDFSAVAACGSTILGIVQGSRTVHVHDTITNTTAPGPRLRSVKRMPVMLEVGDDTVVVMDRLLRRRRDGSSACCFEALRCVPGGGGGWRADPLPDAPVEDLDDEELEDELGEDYFNAVYVSTYFVMGTTRLWISVFERGTFSLDLLEGGAWRVEGSWELPRLQHVAFFVQELGCAVGLVPCWDNEPRYGIVPCHQVCAIDVVEAQRDRRPPVVRHVWKFPAEHAEGVPPGEMICLMYLGNRTFCMTRCVIVDDVKRRGTSFTLLDLDLTTSSLPQLTKRGEPHVHAWPPGHSGC